MSNCKITKKVFNVGQLDVLIDHLHCGGVLAYPTESVWGIGADAFCEQAVEQVLKLKQRPASKGLIVLTDHVMKIKPLLVDLPPQNQAHLLKKMSRHHYQNQAITWLVPISPSSHIPTLLTGGFNTLAVRITTHPTLNLICQKLTSDKNPYGFLVSTSCNIANQPPATTFLQAANYFGDSVGYLMDESLGFDKPSQIIDLSSGKIIR
ncbi:Sua5/YciO/YrdC/YwlC family protein [Moraxella nasovis]|uniref:L-threonylcarbamoyladenylate synthase n=1 Tax=Moraxella nasovis TaxID=2904121 RepID=UPI001F6068F1|nr:L-threonylcarbamoyladenylate synthase [Moraxella nasovis]UNU72508.1 Sua5/YciO/YrdC/YwlC family protein [Moraxella nasovis]